MSVRTRLDKLERKAAPGWCTCVFSDEQVVQGIVGAVDEPEICPVCGGRRLAIPWAPETPEEHAAYVHDFIQAMIDARILTYDGEWRLDYTKSEAPQLWAFVDELNRTEITPYELQTVD